MANVIIREYRGKTVEEAPKEELEAFVNELFEMLTGTTRGLSEINTRIGLISRNSDGELCLFPTRSFKND